MKSLLLLFVLIISPSMFGLEYSGKFVLVSGNFTWHQAKADAELRGGHLATFTSAEEWDNMLADVGSTIGQFNWWMGATDELQEGLWKWVTGEPWSYTNWCPWEPNNYRNTEHYLVTWGEANQNRWNDIASTANIGYILEISSHTVVFNPTEFCEIVLGGAETVQQVPHGSGVSGPSIRGKDGYYFMGWDASLDSITADITVNAISRQRFDGADGSEGNPLELLLPDELAYLSQNKVLWDKHVVLLSDLDLSGFELSPIGTFDIPFTGNFNGRGHLIENFEMTDVLEVEDLREVGLFGFVAESGIIENLGLLDCEIYNLVRFSDVGLLAGRNDGLIRYCYSFGYVDGVYVTGGLVGYNTGIIANCYSKTKCSGMYFVGGLVGENAGYIDSCYAVGSALSQRESLSANLVSAGLGSVVNCSDYSMLDYVMNTDDGYIDAWQELQGDTPILYWEADSGDANYDGVVDVNDMMIMASWWLESSELILEERRLQCDFNYDGIVNLSDLMAMLKSKI